MSLGGVSMMSRCCLGGSWLSLGGVSLVSLGGVSMMSRCCLGGVLVVSWWCVTGVRRLVVSR